MNDAPKLDLVLLWHMHQPDYRDAVDGRFMLPWVYLHAIKDYVDMAAHHERHPGVRAVFNFVPVLLEQIEDYAAQCESGAVRDPLLALLRVDDLESIDDGDLALILESCFHANHTTMLQPYPQYRRLLELYRATEGDPVAARLYLCGRYRADLLTWYHLAWIGESERRTNPLFGRLMAQGAGFSHADRIALFDAIRDILCGLVARYRALAETGTIELSTTPRTHPIGPLLIDFAAARDTIPDAGLPSAPAYPGGAGRLDWHLRTAIESHARRFGAPPAGLWPAEGAVSGPFVAACEAAGIAWVASSESVLANSLGDVAARGEGRRWLHRAWTAPDAPGVTMVFRDEQLSDQIGFEYSKWHGREAAEHLVGALEAIARDAPPGETPLVLIAMDGENAWEYFPYNAFYFFEELYGALGRHPFIRTRTMSEALACGVGRHAARLPRLAAGSWVLGTLSTWIGEPSKNAAWDLLCAAKRACDETLAAGGVAADRLEALQLQLAACEGSDWFWWLGSHNPPAAVERFDTLFRHNLGRLYELLGREPPAELRVPLAAGGGHPESGGTMRRATG